MNLPRPPRRRTRRDPVGVHRPQLVAPETADEVLERAAGLEDVPRETSAGVTPYVAGGLPPGFDHVHQLVAGAAQWPTDARSTEDETPPLSKTQIARLEALTAQWTREVRVGGPGPDDTLLYGAPTPPVPPPSSRSEGRPPADVTPPPAPADDVVAARSAELHADDAPPAPGRDLALDQGPAESPRRVSDWVSRHDPRSLAYGVRQRLHRAVPLHDVQLADYGVPVLDQGTTPPLSLHDASACVGMALATAANVMFDGVERGRAGVHRGILREDDARQLYALAQRRDQVHGEDYAGTSVLGGLLAGRELGHWGEFLWALGGTKDVAQVLLQLELAVVVGIPWDEGLETPDAAGVIRPGGRSLGGHALAITGLAITHAGRPGPWFIAQQSRGPSEGLGGRVFIHHRTLAQLLAGIGEAGVPLPVGGLA